MKKVFITIIILAAMTGSFFGGIWASSKTSKEAPPVVMTPKKHELPKPFQEPELVAVSKKLGIHPNNIERLEMKYVDSMSSEDRHLDPGGAFMEAGYLDDNGMEYMSRYPVIEVKRGLSDADTMRVFAHEYMHHIYYARWASKQTQSIEQSAYLAYNQDEGLRNRLDPYTKANTLRTTEVVSYLCTEFDDSRVPSNIRRFCSDWFDRSALGL